ncbi:membrane-bound alkaline phosphatase-like [Ostrinia furnacalis]|uniref:membrane-bound alkaline phosphatase-like n=1 Tax=Ostrinia furnacalis TaxID=93504 RepID=UPI00103CA8CD|nr:membrane-bound alkaline phosphatase-like [Ostrinia furnacalis]
MPCVLLAMMALAYATVHDRGESDGAYEYEHPQLSIRSSAVEHNPQHWADDAAAGIEKRLRHRNNRNVARNIVMFLGDGMSVPTIAAARILLGQRNGQTGEEAQLSFETFPTTGFTKTYCLDGQIPDSACTATAYLCGAKTNLGNICLNGDVMRRDCEASTNPDTHIESIAAWALKDGRDAGIVTTARVTHASPAGAYANVANRMWENDASVVEDGGDPERCPDIAHQLINMSPGNQFKVILGGGRREFLPVNVTDEEGSPGLRHDNRDLIQEWEENKASQNASYAYVWNREQLMNLSTSMPDYLLGLFESSHMQFHLEADNITEPTLAEMTEIAIKSLRRNEKGFFLFVESGRIDIGHHGNLVEYALDETIRMHDAVKVATELLLEEDTLIVVTADHAHVMSFSGYAFRGGDILGVSGSQDWHRMPYMTLSYANGPGARMQVKGVRRNLTEEENFRKKGWRSHADVPIPYERHGGDDVGVFARGPHHDMFSGVFEESQLPYLMAYAGCFGPGPHACNAGPVAHTPVFLLGILIVYQIRL